MKPPQEWVDIVEGPRAEIFHVGDPNVPEGVWGETDHCAIISCVCEDCGFLWLVLMHGETGGVCYLDGFIHCPVCTGKPDGSEDGICRRRWYHYARYRNTPYSRCVRCQAAYTGEWWGLCPSCRRVFPYRCDS